MDNLSVSDEYYDKKYKDMQVRLDKLYDEIEEIETFIEAVETRLYNIKQEKISGDNVYQFLLFFDNLYDRFMQLSFLHKKGCLALLPCSLFISLFNSFGRTAIDIILRTRTAFRQYLEHYPSESSRRPAW